MKRRSFLTAALALAVLAVRTDALATSIAVPFSMLVSESAAAVLVTPSSEMAVWEADRIVTYTKVHVDSVVAGSVPGEELSVRTLGGIVGTTGQSVDGEAALTVGRPALLFLRPASVIRTSKGSGALTVPHAFSVTAQAQGEFPVRVGVDGVTRVRRSGSIGGTVPLQGALASAPRAMDVLHGLTIDDARRTISAGWATYHAP